MDLHQTDDFADILTRVSSWPVDQRISLAQQLLEGVKETLPSHEPRKKSIKDLIGLLKTSDRAPSDEECRQIIDEARERKYGQ